MNDITKTKVQHDEWNNIWSLDTVSNTDNKYVEVIWILKEEENKFSILGVSNINLCFNYVRVFSSPQNVVIHLVAVRDIIQLFQFSVFG